MKPKPKGKGKKGAPAGNRNARTHGLYSKPKPITKTQALTIEQRRNIADEAIIWIWTNRYRCQNVGDIAKLMNALRNAMDSANGCERTLAIIQGKYTPIDIVLEELKAYDPEED